METPIICNPSIEERLMQNMFSALDKAMNKTIETKPVPEKLAKAVGVREFDEVRHE